jgi:tRNA(Ile)-lysidine synthase
MNLEVALDQFVEQHFPDLLSKRILLAVSGGPDSMALLSLFGAKHAQIAVAHCNFGLRGTESDGDETFVKQHCTQLGIPFYTRRFETATYANTHAVSIQVAARELRYGWFNQLCSEHAFDHIATAHHQDDQAETVLMNMVRGSGIKGLTGIPVSNGNIIRPLLFATKKQLMDYLNVHQVSYRTDVSNLENKYTRNKLRNTILPQLAEINPQAIAHLDNLSKHALFAYELIREKTNELASVYLSVTQQSATLVYDTISKKSFASLYLYELISEYGFNTVQCDSIHTCFVNTRTGSRFLSDTHELIVDRVSLIISSLEKTEQPVLLIDKRPQQSISIHSGVYLIELIDVSAIAGYKKNHLYISADNLSFPLTCRTWKQGDCFHPLGAPGSKKVSDFLIDQKVNGNDKRYTNVLEDPVQGIIAVNGHRIDDRFKITPGTQTAMHVYKKGDH